jgi:hypothetical protein
MEPENQHHYRSEVVRAETAAVPRLPPGRPSSKPPKTTANFLTEEIAHGKSARRSGDELSWAH